MLGIFKRCGAFCAAGMIPILYYITKTAVFHPVARNFFRTYVTYTAAVCTSAAVDDPETVYGQYTRGETAFVMHLEYPQYIQ